MKHVREWVDLIGHQRFADALGVGPTAVYNWKARGAISAQYYPQVLELCEAAGVDPMPLELFTFRQVNDQPERVAS